MKDGHPGDDLCDGHPLPFVPQLIILKMAKYQYRNSPIDHIISQPLIAVARAQNILAKEQIDLLLNMCFREKNGALSPVMITMTIQNGFLDDPAINGDAANIKQIEARFEVPLISLLPINALSIGTAAFNFGIDVLSAFKLDQANSSNAGETERLQLSGKVRSGKTIVTDLNKEPASGSEDGMLNVVVHIATVPLSGGIRDVLDLYSKNVDLKSDPDRKV